MKNWKYFDSTNTIVFCETESCLASVLSQEELAAVLPADTLPPAIKSSDFTQAIKNGLGGIKSANILARKYPLLYPALSAQNWPDVQDLIIDALTTNTITQLQYDAIKAAAVQCNIPVTL